MPLSSSGVGFWQVAKAPIEIRSLARSHTELAIQTLAGVARCGESETARVMASCALLDRGWGKAPQAIAGENGEGPVQVIVRHIVRETKTIDHLPIGIQDKSK